MSRTILLPSVKPIPDFIAAGLGNTISGLPAYEHGRGIAVDSSGNIAVAGYRNVSGGNRYGIISYYDAAGDIQWKKRYDPSGTQENQFNGVAFDNSGNVVTVGRNASDGSAAYVKFSSTGATLFERRLIVTSKTIGWAVAIDPNTNEIVMGGNNGTNAQTYTNPAFGIVAKMDGTTGATSWVKRYFGGTVGTTITGIAVNASSEIFICGLSYDNIHGTTYPSGFVAKLNSSGVVQWMRGLGNSGAAQELYGMGLDPSGDVIAAGRVQEPLAKVMAVKYDSTGAIQWQRLLTPDNTQCNGMSVDSNGDAWLACHTTAGSDDGVMTKLDGTNGTTILSRRISGSSGGNDRLFAGTIGLNDTAHFTGTNGTSSTINGLFAGAEHMLIFKCPGDGSGVGTTWQSSNTWSYSNDPSSSNVAGSWTDVGVTPSETSPAFTEGATTHLQGDSDLTYVKMPQN